MKIETLEIAGFIGCLESLRLPYKLQPRSIVIYNNFSEPTEFEGEIRFCSSSNIMIHPKDLKLLQALIKKGDEHSKSVRLINATAKINAPLFWWNEENTYTSGVTRGCSESTMHTLKKEVLTYNNFEGGEVLDLQNLIDNISKCNQIEIIKSWIPSSYLQTRIINYNYQTLRRIWLQRRKHALPQWHIFVDWIKTLPLANELILIE